MFKKVCSVLATSLLLGLVSCNEDNPWMGDLGQGAIKLSLTTNGEVKDAIPTTRASVDGSRYFEVPSAADFSVLLEKSDGSFSKTYERLEHFESEPSFSTGSYRLEVFHGRLEDQGFGKPYMRGEERVTVLEGHVTEVTVNATVANSLVNIGYTDEFKNYLKDYSAVIQSGSYDPVAFDGDETRTAFVAPGEVTLTLSFTNAQNQSVTIQPASFVAEAGHHYNIKFNVAGEGEISEKSLEIIFDDELTQETVEIDLTEELFTAPGPVVTASGFTENGQIEFLEGAENEAKYIFNVISYGGMSSVKLSLSSDNNFASGFGDSVELLRASASQQEVLKNLGFEIRGLFNKPDKMAIVDFTNFVSHLPTGHYTLTLQAVDGLYRSSLPVNVSLVSVSPTIEAEGLSALYGLNTGAIKVTYTGSNPGKDLSFKAKNKGGIYIDAPIIGVDEVAKTRSIATNSYIITVKLADTEWDPVPVDIYLYGKPAGQVTLPVQMPAYNVKADGFAKKALILVEADEEQLPVVTQNLCLFIDGKQIDDSRIDRNTAEGIITISGLNPATPYTVQCSLRNSVSSTDPSVTFTTESENALENSNFEQTSLTINISSIPAGGQYDFRVGIFNYTYQNKSSISINTPDKWGNVNSLTCYEQSSPMNTWYVVPSTLVESEGKVKMRTVGYNHNGPQIPKGEAAALRYYSPLAPSMDAFNVAAGQLYYGSDAQGASFTTRPSSLEFAYEFNGMTGEAGGATVKVYSGSQVIGEGSLNVTEASGTAKVDIKYFADRAHFGAKATKISVVFLSSTAVNPAINIPSGDALNDNPSGVPNVTSGGSTLSANSYKSFASGSELTVSNVKLNY